jgi:uncharacterized lipoprotein YddW (UPF0748 family)
LSLSNFLSQNTNLPAGLRRSKKYIEKEHVEKEEIPTKNASNYKADHISSTYKSTNPAIPSTYKYMGVGASPCCSISSNSWCVRDYWPDLPSSMIMFM